MDNNSRNFSIVIMSLILSLGILGCGYFISKGFYASRVNQPYITVKGLAERNVKSDLAVWRIPYAALGNDITSVNSELVRQQLVVLNYVKSQGFDDKDISLDQVKLTDRYAVDYGTNKPEQRYILKGGVRIRSTDVERVRQASQTASDLIKQGVAISSETEDNANPAFYYTQLNSIRPAMLSEATRSARQVAALFAKNSDSHLGAIRRASQGIFEITSQDVASVTDSNNAWQIRRDEQGSILKKIRLVSTIDYYLEK